MKEEKDWTEFFIFKPFFSKKVKTKSEDALPEFLRPHPKNYWKIFSGCVLELAAIPFFGFFGWLMFLGAGLLTAPSIQKAETLLEANNQIIIDFYQKDSLSIPDLSIQLCRKRNFWKGSDDYFLKTDNSNIYYIGYGRYCRIHVTDTLEYKMINGNILFDKCLELQLYR